jgi:hypothetical protein
MPTETAPRAQAPKDRWSTTIKVAEAITAVAGAITALAALMHYVL